MTSRRRGWSKTAFAAVSTAASPRGGGRRDAVASDRRGATGREQKRRVVDRHRGYRAGSRPDAPAHRAAVLALSCSSPPLGTTS